MTSRRKTELATPDIALASYLDDLLQTAVQSAREAEVDTPAEVATPERTTPEIETRAPAKPAQAPERPRSVTVAPPPVMTEPLAPAGPAVARAVPGPAKTTVVPAKAEPVTTTVPSAPMAEPEAPPTRPAWSERPFECLIFRVAGLQLAVPLVLLGAIHRLDNKVKPIPGRPRWYMGMLPGQDQNLRVVDTAEWIMAGRVPDGARDQYRFVIRLDNSDWALACDDVAQSFTLDPEEVRWRSGRSKRPWLAGTVIKHMCALIDVGTMASLLARAEREHRLQLE